MLSIYFYFLFIFSNLSKKTLIFGIDFVIGIERTYAKCDLFTARMASSEAPFRFAVQERSFPVPSGSPSQTVDWLPDYYGYGWVAFASISSLVISIIKSPTRRDELDLGICQVIDAPAALITCVRWAPPLALLAASSENLLSIYTPQFSYPHDLATPSGIPTHIQFFPLESTMHIYITHTYVLQLCLNCTSI